MILSHLLKPEILEMIQEGQLNELRDFLSKQPAPDIAELMVAVNDRERLLLFRMLPRQLAAEVFSFLQPSAQDLLLQSMAQEEVRNVLAELSPDDRTALFEELPAEVTQRLLSLLPESERSRALALLSYPRDSVGRLMTDRFVAVKPDWTVAQALDHIRKTGRDSETISMVYVTDEAGRLIDDIRLRKIILSDPQLCIRDLMDSQFVALNSQDDREVAVRMFRKYDLYAMPVVDKDNVLLGIVTADDILHVAEEEATEDFHKLGTVRPLHMSLREASVSDLVRKRVGWLIALVFVNLLSGAGMAMYEETIAAVVTLVFFLPLLIDSSGNAGSQSATLIVRALATGDVRPADWARMLGREILVSAVLGLAMGAMVFLLGLWRGGLAIGAIVAVSMFCVILVGSIIGLLLPFILSKLKLDPAAASAPLITSIADICGVLIYFSIAHAWLGK
jgi:magnesium transporter